MPTLTQPSSFLQVVDAVWDRVPEILVLEVMRANLDGLVLGLKFPADRLEIPDQLTLLGIDAAVEAIEEDAWQRIEYPDGGEAQIAETVYGVRRLIVRRTRLLGAQAELGPGWRHFCFITNRTDDLTVVEAEHREHAVVEQVIADLKDQALAHFPSREFHANGAFHAAQPTLPVDSGFNKDPPNPSSN
jgi:hypothetical protein